MTVTVDLDVDVQQRLEAEATRRGVDIGEVIAGLANTLPAAAPKPSGPAHRMAFIGMGDSGDGDLSVNYKHYRREKATSMTSDDV